MPKRTRIRCAFFVAACLGLCPVLPAAAQPNIAAAAKAFSLGQQAELAGDHRAAAEHYELADRMVASPEALRSAMRARLKTGDEAMAATHAESLERRYSDEKSRQVASETLGSLRPKLARVSLTCTPACGVVVDGGARGVDEAPAHVFYLEPGRHTIGAGFGSGGTQQEMVDAQAGKSTNLTLAAPEPAALTGSPAAELDGADDRPRGGLPRGWFIASAAITVVLAGATAVSWRNVLDKNSKYEAAPTQDGLDEGRRAEKQTNVLLLATGAAALGTGLIAVWTRWSSGERASASTVGIAPSAGGAVVVLGGHFR